MAVGLYLLSMLGADATVRRLMPGFVLFGFGAGLMQVPLTNTMLQGQPPEQSGVASALLNASREVAGLLRDHGDRRDPAVPAEQRAAARAQPRAARSSTATTPACW